MKKLNNKGFTLVELLAVIIILAIVVGISIPSVTNIINNSKNSALGIAVESALDYLKDQYDIYNIDSTSVSALTEKIINGEETGIRLTESADLEALGFDPANVNVVFAKIDHDGSSNTATFCVRVEEIDVAGDYFITSYWDNSTGKLKTTAANGVGVKNQAGNGC